MPSSPTIVDCELAKSPRAANVARDEPKLRSACDGCHAAKIRCSGELPCTRCAREETRCHYSYKSKIGKPKGSLNKKTIERLRQMSQERQGEATSTAIATAIATAPATAIATIAPRETLGAAPLPAPPSSHVGTNAGTVAPLSQDAQSANHAINSDQPFSFTLPPSESLFYSGEDHDWMQGWLPDVPGTDLEKDSGEAEDTNVHDYGRIDPDMDVESDYSADFWRSAQPSGQFQTSCPLLSPYSPSSLLDAHPLGCSSFAASPTCSCFSTMSNYLCELQANTRATRQARAVDALLAMSQCTMVAVRALFDCQSCMRDTQGLLLANMVLSRLVHWTQQTLSEPSTRQVSAQVRLGKYTASRELGIMATQLLLQTHCIDLKRTVDRFQHRVGQIGHGKADRDYLVIQAQSFQQGLRNLHEKAPKTKDAS